jgi:hypothetical protein
VPLVVQLVLEMWKSSLSEFRSKAESASEIREISLVGALGWSTPAVNILTGDDFVYVELSPGDWDVMAMHNILMEFLWLVEEKHFQKIREVELEYIRIGNEEAARISHLITKAPKLNSFILKDVAIGNESFALIGGVIAKSPSLVVFSYFSREEDSLSEDPLEYPNNVGVVVSDMLSTNQFLSTLRLRINETYLIPACLFKPLQSFSILTLDLSSSTMHNVSSLCDMLRSNISLVKLSLSGVTVQDPKGLGKIFSAILESRVESLDLNRLNLEEADVTSLSHYLKKTTNLTSIEFGRSSGQEKDSCKDLVLMNAFSATASCLPISRICLSGDKLVIQSCHISRVFTAKNLVTLYLEDVVMSSDCAENIASIIAKGSLSLENLHLIQVTWDTETNVLEIVKALKGNQCLRKMEIGKVRSLTASKLFQELCKNENLDLFSVQSLDKTGFQEDAYLSLIELIKLNKTLEILLVDKFTVTNTQLTVQLDRALDGNTSLLGFSMRPAHFSKDPLRRNVKRQNEMSKMVIFFAFQKLKADRIDKYVLKDIFDMAEWD